MKNLQVEKVSYFVSFFWQLTFFKHSFMQPNNRHTVFKHPFEVLLEILSFLRVKQLLHINSASWRLYRASQLIYEPIRRPYHPRNLGQVRIVGHGSDFQLICAEFIFENTVTMGSVSEFNGPANYKRMILSTKISRRDAEREFERVFPSLSYPHYGVSVWPRLSYHMESDVSDENTLCYNLPNTKPPSNVRLIGPIMIGLCKIDENNVNILFYALKKQLSLWEW